MTETASRDQILKHERGDGKSHFPCSAHHEQDWQPCPVDRYFAISDDHIYIYIQTHIYQTVLSVACNADFEKLAALQTVCVCVFSSRSFWTSSSLDVPAGVTQEEGHTGFLTHLSAVRALIFLARRIQPFLSLVDREVEFLCANDLIVLHPLGIFIFIF